jgi:hypothetical protein
MRMFATVMLNPLGRTSMIKTFVAIGLGAVIVFSPLAAMAQSTSGTAHAGGGGSHRSHMRHSGNMSRERARASAEHMRMMRHAPAAPKS